MDKKLKWVIAIGIVIILAVPSSILLIFYLQNIPSPKDERMIHQSGIYFIHPTPNSDIALTFSVRESQVEEHYLYQFNFTFDISKGVEPIFILNDRIYNNTQLYLSIKANNGLEFYTVVQILNTSEFLLDDSQVEIYYEIESSIRFDNLAVEFHKTSSSNEGIGFMYIGGSTLLFSKEQSITVEDISDFSGTMHFWINENNYNLSYDIFPDLSVNYSVNSSIGELELFIGQISILGTNGTRSSQIGNFRFPFAPESPGYHSDSYNITLTTSYQHISFQFLIGVDIVALDLEYEIVPNSEILDQLAALVEEQRQRLWKTLFNSTVMTILGVLTILGCMVNYPKKDFS